MLPSISHNMRYHGDCGIASVAMGEHRTKCDDGSMPKPKPEIAPNRLKDVLDECGKTQEWLSEKLGVHWQTISRLVNSHAEMTWSRAVEIGRILGVNPLSILGDLPESRQVWVRGTLQAGEWTESFEWDDGARYEIGIPDKPEYRAAALYGAEIRGESMNQVYPPGSIVLLERRVYGPHDLEVGARYHVEIQRADGKVENTLKKVRVRPDGTIWLIPESDDPAFQSPIQIDHAPGEHVSIVGRVVASYRPE